MWPSPASPSRRQRLVGDRRKRRTRSPRASVGTVRPAHGDGLGSFPPASLAAALSSAAFAGCSRSFRRSQTAETVTNQTVRARERRNTEGRVTSSGQETALWARCFACRPGHRNKAARLRPAKATAVAVSPTGFRFAALGNRSASLVEPNRDRHVAAQLRPARTGRGPCTLRRRRARPHAAPDPRARGQALHAKLPLTGCALRPTVAPCVSRKLPLFPKPRSRATPTHNRSPTATIPCWPIIPNGRICRSA